MAAGVDGVEDLAGVRREELHCGGGKSILGGTDTCDASLRTAPALKTCDSFEREKAATIAQKN